MSEIQPETKQRIKNIKRERRVLKGRLKQERMRFFIRFVTTVALILLMGFFVRLKGLYMNPNAFKYVESSSVEIINNNIVPSYKIRAVLQTVNPPKGCIFFARTSEIKKKLKQLAPVDNVYIRRYAFPARIQIIIRESTPVVTISPDIKAMPVAYFTDKGRLIGREYLPFKSDIKTLRILSYGNKGDDYHKWDITKINEFQKIAKYIETYTKEPVEYIDCRNPQDIYVKVKTLNIRIGKVDNSLYERIERLPSILATVKIDRSKIKYLDLSWEKVNYVKLK